MIVCYLHYVNEKRMKNLVVHLNQVKRRSYIFHINFKLQKGQMKMLQKMHLDKLPEYNFVIIAKVRDLA